MSSLTQIASTRSRRSSGNRLNRAWAVSTTMGGISGPLLFAFTRANVREAPRSYWASAQNLCVNRRHLPNALQRVHRARWWQSHVRGDFYMSKIDKTLGELGKIAKAAKEPGRLQWHQLPSLTLQLASLSKLRGELREE